MINPNDMCISNFQISGQYFVKRNCHNSRTSDNIDMKLEPVTINLTRKTKTTTKKLIMMSCQKLITLLLFFQFTANLEQFVSKTYM